MSAVSTTEAVARAEPSYGARTARIFLKHIALFLGLMAAWQAASASGLTNPLLFPEPTRILESMYRVYFIQGNVWYHLYVTFAEAMVDQHAVAATRDLRQRRRHLHMHRLKLSAAGRVHVIAQHLSPRALQALDQRHAHQASPHHANWFHHDLLRFASCIDYP